MDHVTLATVFFWKKIKVLCQNCNVPRNMHVIGLFEIRVFTRVGVIRIHSGHLAEIINDFYDRLLYAIIEM